jgi:hypothetical protein
LTGTLSAKRRDDPANEGLGQIVASDRIAATAGTSLAAHAAIKIKQRFSGAAARSSTLMSQATMHKLISITHHGVTNNVHLA